LEALRREARLLAELDHPNIVRVYAWWQQEEEHYLVLQYVSGGSLEGRLIATGPFEWDIAARYLADIADGLLVAHSRNIIHRDVKPANVLWDPDRDEALLGDFGVSTKSAAEGTVAGSRAYMAPEAFSGSISPALDVFALAASLFQLVVGEYPFPSNSIDEHLARCSAGLPDPDLRCQGLPKALEILIRAGLRSKPDDRPTMADFAAQLRGDLNRLLTDSFSRSKQGPRSPRVKIILSRCRPGQPPEPLVASHTSTDRLTRDLKKVPPSPGRITLRTGERIQLELAIEEPGYIIAFNVGPTGNLNLLIPNDPSENTRMERGTFTVLEAELTPPAGKERVVAVWSRDPLPLRLDELAGLVKGEYATPAPYRVTRDLKRVDNAVTSLSPEAVSTASVELDHISR
jgi:serine/threonine protein kinase